MAIVKVLKKENFLNMEDISEGTQIIPVVDVRSIYEDDQKFIDGYKERMRVIDSNIALNSTKIEEEQNLVTRIQGIQKNHSESIQKLNSDLTGITNDIENINNNASKTFNIKGTLKTTTTRAATSENRCVTLIAKDKCDLYLAEEQGSIYFITAPGTYTLGESDIDVEELSMCVYTDNKWLVHSLGIPFIPKPTAADAGKVLKVADNGTLYWGEDIKTITSNMS